MVVDRNRELPLGRLLADYVFVEVALDIVGLRQYLIAGLGFVDTILGNDVQADLNAFVADVNGGPGNQLAHLMLALAAKAAPQHVTVALGHQTLLNPLYNKRTLGTAAAAPLFPGNNDFVNQAILQGALRLENEIAVRICVDLFDWLTRMQGDDLVETLAHPHDVLGVNIDV